MGILNFGLIIGLIEQACLVGIIFYLLSHTNIFSAITDRKPNAIVQIVVAVIFGLLAIYGTYSGIKTSGAIANIRNLAPMIAGLIGGPYVGLGAGLIGGVHRFFMGGFTSLPCALGTIISGLAGGILYKMLKGNLGIWRPALFAFIMEVVDMALILLIARPFADALNLVKVIAIPMILADTAGGSPFCIYAAQSDQGQKGVNKKRHDRIYYMYINRQVTNKIETARGDYL